MKIFEEEIGGKLSEEYKSFLLEYNGGYQPEPELGFLWEGKVEKISRFIPLLFASGGDQKFSSYKGLKSSWEDLRDLGTDGFLPVTGTANDYVVCLSFQENVGKVFLGIYKYHGDIPIDIAMLPLADSFNEFLDMLVEILDPYCRIESLGKQGAPSELDQYLAEGNFIDAIGSKNNLSIICEAIKFDNRPMINACIERGANLSRTIEIAVKNKQTSLIEMLVGAGADINERNKFGDTPLFYVVGTALPGEEGEQNRELQALLLKLGAVK